MAYHISFDLIVIMTVFRVGSMLQAETKAQEAMQKMENLLTAWLPHWLDDRYQQLRQSVDPAVKKVQPYLDKAWTQGKSLSLQGQEQAKSAYAITRSNSLKAYAATQSHTQKYWKQLKPTVQKIWLEIQVNSLEYTISVSVNTAHVDTACEL